MFAKLRHSHFARNVAILSSGTAIAQALPIAISPILTRLYSPEEFGLVAVYLACVAVLSVIATGRYEMAITLPSSDEEAASIVMLTLKLCAVISFSLYLPILLFDRDIAHLLGNDDLSPWLYLLPISVMTTGAFNTFQFWCNRTSNYRRMSKNRVQNAGLSALANLLFGVIKTKGGMIIGSALGQSIATLMIGRYVWQQNHDLLKHSNHKQELALAKRYKSHPMHIAPAQLIGTVAIQIPVLMISSVYSLATAGFFSLAYRLVSLPSGLIAGAIGDVYRQKISVTYNERGEFKDIFIKTLATTSIMALPPFLVLYVISPSLFAFVFGESWRIAGEYAQILVIGAFFQFIFTPIDKGAVVVGATKYIFIWHSTRLVLLVILVLSANYFHISVNSALLLLISANAFLYLVEGVVNYQLSKKKPHA